MDPVTAVTLLSQLFGAAEQLIPVIGEHVKSGTISAADQAALMAKFESLRTRANGEFSGPQWQVTS